MSYHQPESLDAALAALAGGGRLVAGGTDYFPALGERLADHDLIDLTRVPGLSGITETDAGWRIGATTTWTTILRAKLPPAFDGLKAAAREVGSTQIQNAGTIAGNLCNASPAADGVPPLLTLDASVEVTGPGGSRILPLPEFITGVRQTALSEGELVTALHIPRLPDAARSAFRKLGARRYLVISIAMVAVLAARDAAGRFSDLRIAVGACSPVARRLPALEEGLIGQTPSALAEITSEHLAHLNPIDDVRGTADYRLAAVADLIRRAVREAADG
ncbi:FAD binding domain-containing protein [Ovoidimarina sediminis]|uniref:FAD binding domain-containing protein n=1 Tax=Ovoidimarina sediminis TaxID=3079856 RepID=UPI002912CCB7|nr:FAD binding domain-containing protein [Rhodophyticola sp. MJ-SS7]MDU8943288.1 FAD binding domain-containing protein [Rhodophyticola sp. MJ-SS7]